MADATAPRPLLRRVLSFREPLLLIPHLLVFLGTVASAFFHSYASFLQSFARSIVGGVLRGRRRRGGGGGGGGGGAEEGGGGGDHGRDRAGRGRRRRGAEGQHGPRRGVPAVRRRGAELRGGAARVRRVRRRRGRVHRRGGPAGRPGQARVPGGRRRRVRGDDLVQLRVQGRQDEPVPVRQVPRGRPLLTDRPASLF
ncbi:unnamed protein product [Triticum turgidum subsp. durum]|uniref:Uncharacterized protein n=1 Tax=Triticum turgidum subsp. durum TaxID=4567 RepID=A0A9R1NMM7_TRITD|nr:unnamed protein product [Triticum turgidum subsp. durum]